MGDARQRRELPDIWWAVAIVCFPAGVFLAMGAVRAMTWRVTALVAVISHLPVIALVIGLIHTQGKTDTELLRSILLLGMTVYVIGLGVIQFLVGKRKGIWGVSAVRAWKAFGCIGIASVVLQAVGMLVR